MKKTILSLIALAFAVATIGCADPCGDLKDKCSECGESQSLCEASVELVDALGGDDACQDALDAGNVCGD